MSWFKRKAPAAPRRPQLEEIEPRILYSADFAPAALDHAGDQPAQPEYRVVEANGEFAQQQAGTQHQADTRRHEPVLVESDSPDYRKLVDDIVGKDDLSREIELLVLDANQDGIAQINGRGSADANPLARAQAVELRPMDEPQHTTAGEPASAPTADAAAAPPSVNARVRDVLFFDAAVPDADTLIAEFIALRGENAEVEVVQLTSERDGLAQITDALAAQRDVRAMHILSHGEAGRLQLGSGTVDAAALARSADALGAWRQALTEDADILLWGCSIGEGEQGEAFMAQLAALTGADVAASDDATGHAAQGGDWVLEERTGAVEANMAVSATLQEGWAHALLLSPQGGETRVNSQTNAAQTTTDYGGGNVAMDTAGNYVVVWNDAESNDGDIFFQRYDASGVAQGSNVRVNNTTAGPQSQAQVAMDANGNFVVAWQSPGQDGSGDGIYAQRFDASGTPQGLEFRVNTTTSGNQSWPAVAMASSTGDFVIVWGSDGAQDGSAWGIFGQRYNASGVAQGSEFLVNTTTAGGQLFPAVAMGPSGNFVVAWEGNQTGNADVYFQRYDSAGTAQGSETRANATTGGDQLNAAVAIDDGGNFVVAWEDRSGADGGVAGIYARRYDSSGTAQGGEFRVNTTTADGQTIPAVAMNATGGFIVAWQSANQDGSSTGVYAQRYDSGGSAAGGEVRVNTTTTNEQQSPSVAYRGNNAVVAWHGNGGGDSAGVFTQRLTTALVVTNTNNSGAGSLRQAILDANASAGADTITFNIAGTGTHTIAPLAALPDIDGQVTIDATTDDSFAANGSRPAIVLAGTNAGLATTGLILTANADGTTIRGLVIRDWRGDGIEIQANSINNFIVGNYIGRLTTSGTASGAGTQNDYEGITIYGGFNTIGGTTAADRNVISGNGEHGIWMGAGAIGNKVIGNYIGTDASGAPTIGNSWSGVYLENGASSNVIGGTSEGAGNIIAGNLDGDGIEVRGNSTLNNAFLRNSIHSNYELADGLGIDLADDGVSANDSGDGDSGPNGRQNFPVLTGANSNSAGTTIAGTLNSAANTTYRIEFFANRPSIADSPNGEGERYLGFITVTTDGSGNCSFNTTLADVWVNSGDRITATATVDLGGGNYGSTSEFAANVTATATGIIVVDTTSDAADGTTTSITNLGNNRGADGRISLREAIIAANNTANGGTPDRIVFAIPAALSGGAHTINVGATGLPAIMQAVVIDGTSEPDFAGTPIIELNGSGTGSTVDGLFLAAGSDGSTIRGLVINRFGRDGISGIANNVLIAGNYVGTDVAGTVDLGNAQDGVQAGDLSLGGGNNWTIGGTTSSDRNLISGNNDDGVQLFGEGNTVLGNCLGTNAAGSAAVGNTDDGVEIASTASGNTIGGTAAGARNVIAGNGGEGVLINTNTGNVVLGNYIGIDVTGTLDLGNAASGVRIQGGASGNTIGGAAPGAMNVISGNNAFGIVLDNGDNNTIQGNRIGTNAAGTGAIANSQQGIAIVNGSVGNLIGGTSAGVGNLVAYNTFDGLVITDGTGDAILGNTFHSNGGTGIDLIDDGPNANDVPANLDADTGPNNLQNFPVLSSATTNGTQVTITGSLNSTASSYFRIEFFASTSADATGYGEGQRYLGFANVATDGSGNATFSATLTATLAAGESVSATTTKSDATFTTFTDTSEFSQNTVAFEGMALWRTNADTSPNFQIWDGAAYSPAGNSVAIGDLKSMQAAESPTRTEVIVIGRTSGGSIVGQMWDGTSWSALPINPLGSQLIASQWVTDVAYESASGDAMLVWGDGSGLKFTTWNGTSWSAAAALSDYATLSGGTAAAHVSLATKPGGDEMVLAVTDNLGKDYAYVWNGSNWSAGTQVSTGSGSSSAVAYEAQSGHAMIAYADAATPTLYYRIWNGSTWSAQSSVAVTGGAGGTYPAYINLASDPNSDRIAVAITSSGTAGSTVYSLNVWDGSVWSAGQQATASGIDQLMPAIDVAFEGASGEAVATYGVNGSNVLWFRTWTAGGGWSAEQNGPTLGAAPRLVTLTPERGTDRVMLMEQDANSDLYAVQWSGTAWGSATLLEANTGETNSQAFDFVWESPGNIAPVVTTTGTTLAYTENQSPTPVDEVLIVSDVDSTNLTGATVTISGNYVNGQDVLAFTNQLGITGSWNAGTGVLTLTGTTTVANYQIALRSITYVNTSGNPSPLTRTVSFVVTDGTDHSTSASRSISLTGSNDVPSFAVGNGVVTTAVGASDVYGVSSALLPDGKLLVAGYVFNGTNNDFAVAKYNPDGSLDTSFGGGDGIITASIGANDDLARGIVLLADGRFIVAGNSIGASNDFAVMKFNADGTLDTTFGGGDGQVTTAIGTGADAGRAVAVQADGKIVVVGLTSSAGNNNTALVRYNVDGSLDATFGVGGIVVANISPGNDVGHAVTIQADGKMLVAGESGSGGIDDFSLLRFNADGTLDASFGGGDGIVTTSVGAGNDRSYAIVVQSDGRILVAGQAFTGTSLDMAVARYTTTGALDTSFGGGDGIQTVPLSAGDDTVRSIAVQSDGKIVLAGSISNGSNDDLALVRLTADGSLDASLGGGDGITTVDLAGGADLARNVLITPDGRIVLCGYGVNGASNEFAVLRFNAAGLLDTRFNLTDTLGGAASFTEGGAAVVLDTDVQIYDAELTAANNFNGATLTLARNGGANAQDVFSATGTLSSIASASGNVVAGGTTIGTYTNSSGTLVFTFNASATNALVNSAMQQIAYSNSSAAPHASVQINWNFSDGNTGAQGGGGALQATGSTTVTITAVNDAPVLSDTALTMTVAEDAGAPVGAVGSLISAFTGGITDVDASAARGIAIAATNEANGAWYYSTNGGSTWTAVGVVSNTSALLLADDGSTRLYFAPAANFSGTSSAALTLRAWDQSSGAAGSKVDMSVNGGGAAYSSATDTVDVTVTPVNDPLVLVANNPLTVPEEGTRTLTSAYLQSTDVDNTAAQLVYTVTQGPGSGSSLRLNGATLGVGGTFTQDDINNNRVTFRFSDDSFATSFKFTVSDGVATLPEATFSINGLPVNDAPVNTVPATFTVTEDTPSALAGISIADIDAGTGLVTTRLQVSAGVLNVTLSGSTVIFAGSNGSADFTLRGTVADINASLVSLSYTGAWNANGVAAASLTVTTDDGGNTGTGGALQDVDVAQIDITAVNDAPTATIVPASYTVAEQTTLVLHGTGLSVADVDVGVATIDMTLSVSSGTLTVGAGTTGVLSVSGSGTNTVMVIGTLTQLNNLLAGNLGATVTYINGSDNPPASTTLTLSINDGGSTGVGGVQSGSDTATISITPVNDAPTTGNAAGGTSEDGAYAAIMLTGADVDGMVTHFRLTSLPASGTLYLDSSLTTAMATGTDYAAAGQQLMVYFAPNASWNGATSFQFAAKDDQGLVDATPATGTLTITPVNDAPAGTDRTVTTSEDTVYTFAVGDFGFTDPSDTSANNLLAVRIATLPAAGSLMLGGAAVTAGQSISAVDIASGLLRYTPAANANGASYASFTFQVQDDGGTASGGADLDSTPNTITIDITPVNDAPTTSPVSLVAIAEDSGPRLITQAELLANATDIDGPSLTATGLAIATGSGTLVDNGDGTWTYTPAANDDTAVSFNYTVTDGSLAAAGSANLDITPVKDAPTTSPVSLVAIAEDSGPRLITQAELLANTTDIDGPSLTATGLAIATGSGALVDNGDGTWTYTPAANDDTAVSFSYTVTDSSLTAAGTASLDITPVNDVPSGAPVVTGTPTEGQTLTADTSSIADADGLGAFSYQWQRNGVDIGGATGSTYTLGNADVGTNIRVVVSYTDGRASAESLTGASVGPIANVNDAPTGAPVVTGAPTEDQVLSVDTSSVADADGLGAFTYQWQRNGVNVVGATGSTYTLGDADVGTNIRVVVSYPDGQGTAESLASSAVGPIANVNDAPTGSPVVTGTPTEDQVLTANTVSMADADGLGSFNYQWQRDGVDIVGATSSTYTLDDADVGTNIRVVVSYTDGEGTTESLTSAAVGPASNFNDAPTGAPVVTGTPTEGQVLTADTTTIADADGLGTFSYQWQRDGANIAGATGSTYTLADADVGAQISVQVSYADGYGTAESLTSAQTAAVANVNDTPVGGPTVVGTAAEDQTLTADTSGISDADGLGAFSYQWLRNGVAIGGATASTYILGDADVGTTMRVVVSYTDVHGTGESLASAAAGPVTNVNDAPVLGTAALASDPGQAVTLGAANLSATDVDDPAATLVFTVSNVTNGQFELVGAPGAAIASFTQAQINGGQIRFVHDGSNSAPAFSVSISDGSTTVGPYVASGSLTVSALAPAPAPAAALPPLALAAVIAPAGTAIAPRVSGLLQATPLPPSGSEAPAPAEVTLLPSLREPVADEAEVATARAQPLPGRPAALSNALWQGQGTESPRAQPVTLTAGPVVAAAERAPVFWQSAFERDPLKFQPPLSVDWSTAAPFQTNGTGQEQAVEGVEEMQVLVELSRLGGVALSIGTIAWALRATALASRLLVSIPAWRHLDPIPVLAGDDDERSRDFPSDSETVADELGIELMLDSAADRAVRA